MNAIVSIVTAASVLVHAALGCCIAHTHSASVGSVSPSATRHIYKHVHHCHHSHSHEHHDHGGDHPAWPHKHCDDGACTAVVASKIGLQFEAVIAAFDSAPSVDAFSAPGKSPAYVDYSSLQHDLGPPLRPHLCFCVLLI
jgi:hypothetical protein